MAILTDRILWEWSPILLLLAWRCPPHVPSLIVAVVINSIELHALGAQPNLIDELVEAREQEFNPTPTIIGPFHVPWISAARFCGLVGIVFRTAYISTAMSMSRKGHFFYSTLAHDYGSSDGIRERKTCHESTLRSYE